MRKVVVPVFVLAMLVGLAGAPALAAPQPAATCTNVSGSVSGFAVPIVGPTGLVGFNLVFTSVTGGFADSASGALTLETILPGGAMLLSGTHTFTTLAFGQLTSADRVVVAPNGAVHNTAEIVSGGSGFFVSHGTVNAVTGAFALEYQGRACAE
jgi:hypothetical protein